MSLEHKLNKHFQVPLEVRSRVIEDNILKYLPADYDNGLTGQKKEYVSRAALGVHIEKVIDMYAGQDANVLTILSYASQQGRLTQYLTLLERQYNRGTSKYLLPELRVYAEASNMKKSQEFFMRCYADLGVETRDDAQIMQMTKSEDLSGVCSRYNPNQQVMGGTSFDA